MIPLPLKDHKNCLV
jgi:uncharacterized protein (DUF1778 family)/GNAT superfamily N-acetyltransferase